MANINFNDGKDVGSQLVKDPFKWMQTRYVSLAIQGNDISDFSQSKNEPLQQLTNGPIPQSRKFPTGWTYDAVLKEKDGTSSLIMKTSLSKGDKGLRALPWQDNHVTYTQLDDDGRFFATGPLQGCHIYVAGTARNPWVFHANNNSGGGNLQANMASKLKMALDLMSTGLGPQILGGGLTRDQYSTQGFAGFVFGVRQHKRWRFWSYLFNPHNKHWKIQDFPCALTG